MDGAPAESCGISRERHGRANRDSLISPARGNAAALENFGSDFPPTQSTAAGLPAARVKAAQEA